MLFIITGHFIIFKHLKIQIPNKINMFKFLQIVQTLKIVWDETFINFYNFKDIQILAIFHKFQVIFYIPNNKHRKYVLIFTTPAVMNILIL
jgi:hypothetical protein